MDIRDRIAVVTGGGNGIGKALCASLAGAGAKRVVVADLDEAAASEVAEGIGGAAIRCNVAIEAEIQNLVRTVEAEFGPIDIFVSNAGTTTKGGPEAPDEEWQRLWQVNLMSQVYAARGLLPGMLERGGGHLVQVASAAGLLTEIGSAPYSVTKHAVVSFAEWLSVTYQKRGINVSCVCPAGVATEFLDLDDPIHQFLHFSAVTPEEMAEKIVEGIREDRFLIVSHEEIQEFFAFKTTDYDRWLKNFAHLQHKIERQLKRRQSEGKRGDGGARP